MPFDAPLLMTDVEIPYQGLPIEMHQPATFRSVDRMFGEAEQLWANARQSWTEHRRAAVRAAMNGSATPDALSLLDHFVARGGFVRFALDPEGRGLSAALRDAAGL